MDNLELKSIERCAEILKGEIFECNDAECVVLSDAEECYREGYKDAIDLACEWLEDNLLSYWQQCVTDPEEFIKEFHKAMEEEK